MLKTNKDILYQFSTQEKSPFTILNPMTNTKFLCYVSECNEINKYKFIQLENYVILQYINAPKTEKNKTKTLIALL